MFPITLHNTRRLVPGLPISGLLAAWRYDRGLSQSAGKMTGLAGQYGTTLALSAASSAPDIVAGIGPDGRDILDFKSAGQAATFTQQAMGDFTLIMCSFQKTLPTGTTGRRAIVSTTGNGTTESRIGFVARNATGYIALAVIPQGSSTETTLPLFSGSPLNIGPSTICVDHTQSSGAMNSFVYGVAGNGTVTLPTPNQTFNMSQIGMRGTGADKADQHLFCFFLWNRVLTATERNNAFKHISAQINPKEYYVSNTGNDANFGYNPSSARATFDVFTTNVTFPQRLNPGNDIVFDFSTGRYEPAYRLTPTSPGLSDDPIRLRSRAPNNKLKLRGSKRVTSGWTSIGSNQYTRADAIQPAMIWRKTGATKYGKDLYEHIFPQQSPVLTDKFFTWSAGTTTMTLLGGVDPNTLEFEICTGVASVNDRCISHSLAYVYAQDLDIGHFAADNYWTRGVGASEFYLDVGYACGDGLSKGGNLLKNYRSKTYGHGKQPANFDKADTRADGITHHGGTGIEVDALIVFDTTAHGFADQNICPDIIYRNEINDNCAIPGVLVLAAGNGAVASTHTHINPTVINRPAVTTSGSNTNDDAFSIVGSFTAVQTLNVVGGTFTASLGTIPRGKCVNSGGGSNVVSVTGASQTGYSSFT